MALDGFVKQQMDRADKANAALCIALEMLAHLYRSWEYGEPCYAVTNGRLHEDDPIGNAFQLGEDEEAAIVKMLEQFFPSQNADHINSKTWEDRIDALTGE